MCIRDRAIGKYDYQTLVTDSSLAFRKPNSEYWFGTDNLGRDYWCQVWYATQVSIRLALIVAVGESCLLYTSPPKMRFESMLQ